MKKLPHVIMLTAVITLASGGIVVGTTLPALAATHRDAARALAGARSFGHHGARHAARAAREVTGAGHAPDVRAHAREHAGVHVDARGIVQLGAAGQGTGLSRAVGRVRHAHGDDNTPPTCALLRIRQGLPTIVTVAVGDAGSGLASVAVDDSNTTVRMSHWSHGVSYNSFYPGYTGRLLIHLIKPKSAQYTPSVDTIVLRDMAGNVTSCTFYVFQVEKQHAWQHVTGVARADHFAAIVNFGIRTFTFRVNSRLFSFNMVNGLTKLADWGKFFTKASNTVSMHAEGGKSWADVVLWNGSV